jgi:hypothetical protein
LLTGRGQADDTHRVDATGHPERRLGPNVPTETNERSFG